MEQILDIRTAHLPGPTYLTLGNFDGMHLGHCALLERLMQKAAAHPAPAKTALLTFDPHPVKVLRPHVEHRLLTSPAERLMPAARLGIDVGIIQPFNLEIAALSARGFMALLKARLGIAGLVVGPDFALGRNREGDIPRLRAIGRDLGYEVEVIDPIGREGQTVRSSLIREHLRTGHVELARALLGRLYHAGGAVIEGDKRGRLLGSPTANLQLAEDKLWPADGVYATRTWVLIEGRAQPFWSVTNLGVRPTVGGSQRRFETHLLDFPTGNHDGNLYGQMVTVEFVARLRGEIRFAGLDELKAQIQSDIAAARAHFAQADLPPDCVFFNGHLAVTPPASA